MRLCDAGTVRYRCHPPPRAFPPRAASMMNTRAPGCPRLPLATPRKQPAPQLPQVQATPSAHPLRTHIRNRATAEFRPQHRCRTAAAAEPTAMETAAIAMETAAARRQYPMAAAAASRHAYSRFYAARPDCRMPDCRIAGCRTAISRAHSPAGPHDDGQTTWRPLRQMQAGADCVPLIACGGIPHAVSVAPV